MRGAERAMAMGGGRSLGLVLLVLAGAPAAAWLAEVPAQGAIGQGQDEPPSDLCRMYGRVVDARGRQLVRGWRVSAVSGFLGAEGDRAPQRTVVELDPESGEYCIDDLPAGFVLLSAVGPPGYHIRATAREVKAGQTRELDLVYDGPDRSKRVVLRTHVSGFPELHPKPEHVWLVDPAGVRRPLALRGRSKNTYEADGLGAGAYTIEIDDPRFEPWRKEHVGLASETRALLRGSASIQLVVRGPESEQPIAAYDLELAHAWLRGATKLTLAEATTTAPSDGLFSGLVPGKCALLIEVPGLTPLLRWLELEPGVTHALDVTVGLPRALSGRVLRADGSPAVGARVWLRAGGLPERDEFLWPTHVIEGLMIDAERGGFINESNPHHRPPIDVDDEGRFGCADLTCDAYTVRASEDEGSTQSQIVQLEERALTHVQVVLAP